MSKVIETSAGEQALKGAPDRLSLQTFNSLRHRDYRLLWFSIIFTSAGQWMEQIALSWLIYQMTDSAFMLGAINGARAIPMLLLGPWGGVAADRFERKKLMLVSQAYIMVLTSIMAVLILGNWVQVWHIFVYTLLVGIGWSLTQPVRQSLVPNLVPREDLMNAIALQSAAFNSTRVLGPAAAGLLVAWVGAGGAFAAEVVAYVFILALVWLMQVPLTPVVARRPSMASSLLEGFRYIGASQVVLWLIILALIPMLLAMPIMTLMPVFARDVLGMGAKGYGLLLSASGVGALTATLIVASLGNFRSKGLLLLSAGIGLGAALVLFSRSTWLPLSLFLVVFVGGFQMTYMALNNTMLHLNIIDAVRGRVMSIYMLDMGLAPLGSLFAGTVADFFGAPLAVTVMGSAVVVLMLIALKQVPHIRQLE